MQSATLWRGVVVVIAITVLLISISPTPAEGRKNKRKTLVLKNNSTNYMSVRCFSFHDDMFVHHLKAGETLKFDIEIKTVLPSSTMFNCSTNVGTFVAYRHDYICATRPQNECRWMFDDVTTAMYDPEIGNWVRHEYNPTYESLERGGVVRGFYAN